MKNEQMNERWTNESPFNFYLKQGEWDVEDDVFAFGEKEIQDVENEEEREFGGEEREEPLRSVHVSLQAQILEVRQHVRQILQH